MRKSAVVGFSLAFTLLAASAAAQDAAPAAPDGPPKEDQGAKVSLQLRAGYAIPMGNGAKDQKMSEAFAGAIPFTLDATYRVTPALRVGAYGSFALVTLPSEVKDSAEKSGISVSASWLKFGIEAQYHLGPFESVDPWVGYGLGLEGVTTSISGGGASLSGTTSGIEFAHLMAGANFKAADKLGVGPFVDFSLGQYSTYTSSSGKSGDITEKAMHQWLYFGVAGNFDL